MSAPTPTTEDLVEQIRDAFAQARSAGQPLPGRPTLAKLTGATDYRVRVALAELAEAGEPADDQLADAGDADHQTGAPPTASIANSTGRIDRDAVPDRQPASDQTAGSETAPAPGRPAGESTPRPTDAGDSIASAPAAPISVGDAVPVPAAPVPAGAKVVSWAGFVFGSVMSVAANVLHTWLPAARMPPGWSPGIAAQIGSAVWPIGLLLSVEVLSRVRWPQGWGWSLARFGGTGTVALGSAVISYGHVQDVLAAWGYGTLASLVGPLVLDGLMLISGFALLAMSSPPTGISPERTR